MSLTPEAVNHIRWPRYQHVIFDCDSTLSRIEGIDELAGHPDTRSQVAELTNAAMDGGLPLDQVYGERLNILNPTRGAVRALRSKYKRNLVEDAAGVLQALRALGHDVYIVSGGLLDPVREFGISLGVPPDQIRAVDIEFDQLSGEWWDTGSNHWQDRYLAYQQTALAESDGKARIIGDMLHNKTGRALLVGDGVSDLLAAGSVDLFVGYCGVVKRERVCKEAPLYLECGSLAPLLWLVSDHDVISRAEPGIRPLLEKGRRLVEEKALRFNNPALASRFKASLDIRSDNTRVLLHGD